MVRVLSVGSEIYPLVKTGGLGDVMGALPPALGAAGAETTTMVPGYPAVMDALPNAPVVHAFADLFGGPALVRRGTAAALDLLVLDAPHLYARGGNPYLGPDGREWADNGIRFAALGAAAAAGAVPAHGNRAASAAPIRPAAGAATVCGLRVGRVMPGRPVRWRR